MEINFIHAYIDRELKLGDENWVVQWNSLSFQDRVDLVKYAESEVNELGFYKVCNTRG